jgi:glycosyltransferase involved in cell wall biosynthesis
VRDPRTTILFFHASAELYGSDQTLLQLARGLDRERFRCVVALPRLGPLVEPLRAAGATVELGPLCVCGRATLAPRGLLSAARDLPRSIAWARALIRRHQPDVVHTNTIVVPPGAFAARAEGVPHVTHVHEIMLRPRWLARGLAGLFGGLSDVVVANSEATRSHLLGLDPRLERHARVVRNGVPEFAPRAGIACAADARRELGIDPDAAWIVLVGRVNALKGQALLLDAFERVADVRPDARLLFAGDAPPGQDRFVAELERRIAASRFRERVVRLPFRRDVDVLYRAADVVAVPSLLPESFGLVAAEAMTCERPVVAARHGGLLEVVEDGVTGLHFTPGDADELARALARLLDQPGFARELGQTGRARQRELFGVSRYCREFEALYAELAAARVQELAA